MNNVTHLNPTPDGNGKTNAGFPEGRHRNRFICKPDGTIEFQMFHAGMSRACILNKPAQVRELFNAFDGIIAGDVKRNSASFGFQQTDQFYGQILVTINYQVPGDDEIKSTSYYVDWKEFQRLYVTFLDACEIRAEALMEGGHHVA